MKLWTICYSGVMVRAGATMRSSSQGGLGQQPHGQQEGHEPGGELEQQGRQNGGAHLQKKHGAHARPEVSLYAPWAKAPLRIQGTGMCAPAPDALPARVRGCERFPLVLPRGFRT